MNVQVVSDARGRIISISSYGDAGPAPSGIANAGVILERGQQLHALDVPTEFQARPLVELIDLMKVEHRGSTARLVAAARPVGRRATAKRAAAKTTTKKSSRGMRKSV